MSGSRVDMERERAKLIELFQEFEEVYNEAKSKIALEIFIRAKNNFSLESVLKETKVHPLLVRMILYEFKNKGWIDLIPSISEAEDPNNPKGKVRWV